MRRLGRHHGRFVDGIGDDRGVDLRDRDVHGPDQRDTAQDPHMIGFSLGCDCPCAGCARDVAVLLTIVIPPTVKDMNARFIWHLLRKVNGTS